MELYTNLIPIQSGGHTRRKSISYRTQAKITARYKKVVSTVLFFISLSLYGTSNPRKFSTFSQQLNLFRFRKIFPKHPWDWEPCRETVKNDKTSWDSEQNHESWQVCIFQV